MAQIVDRRPVGRLRPHPENARIYADGADDGLVESVRAKGILNPLLITPHDLVISGHRRLDAALRAGLAEVPVVVFASADELDILDALLESNRQRAKDGDQLRREIEVSLLIETERAKLAQRMAGVEHGRGQKLPRVVGEAKSPTAAARHEREAMTRAARRVGVSAETARRAVAVGKAMEALKESGAEQEAENLQRTLKTRSVSKAWTQARADGHIAPTPPAVKDSGLDKTVITLPVWHGLTPAQRGQVLARPRAKATFNEQKSTDIEWAQWSWNPVVGCKHDCSYCYARDIAEGKPNRPGYAWGFVPAFLPERLGAPAATRVPEKAERDAGYRNVFTCSMADLFGRWVPAEWIEAVLEQVRANPQWTFLFLTKFPIRLREFDFPDNAWVGTTVDAQARVANAERAFADVNARVKWLSCEPLLEPLRFERLELFQWIVMGGASPSSQTPAWRPRRAWVDDLRAQARRAGCAVYEKTNLLVRLREYPGQPEPEPISVPDAFKMGYLQRDVLEPDAYATEVTP